MSSRRNFIQQSVLGIAGTAVLPLMGNATRHDTNAAPAAENSLQIGMAGYTFAKYDLDKSIEIMKRVNVKNLSVKDFHLPLDSTSEKIQSVLAQFAAGGINVYAVGVIY